MTRVQAWEKFQEEHWEEKEQIRQAFWDNLQERLGKLMQQIYGAFDQIREQAQNQEKEDCMHFLFSLQRCDLLEQKAIIRLDVTNLSWYADETPLTVSFDVTFLFQEYFEWQDKLLQDMRTYMGKVNKYDISALIQDEIMICNQLVAHILRFAFRDLEKQEVFCQISKLPYWIIRWGEYKDYSEIVIQVKREVKGLEAWQDKLALYEENPNVFAADHWYKEKLDQGDCQGKNMFFIFFEECSLKGIDFRKADLSGARFFRCQIEACKFFDANLNQADFEGCSFVEVDFQGASLMQATFSVDCFHPELFDERQKEELLVKEGGGEAV